jgi:hypothetical protein
MRYLITTYRETREGPELAARVPLPSDYSELEAVAAGIHVWNFYAGARSVTVHRVEATEVLVPLLDRPATEGAVWRLPPVVSAFGAAYPVLGRTLRCACHE